jgi:hypothetical protein
MSMTSPTRTPMPARDDDVDLTDSRRSVTTPRQTRRETKPSPKTSELWLTIVGVGVLAVIYNASHDHSLNLFRACLLSIILTAAYIVSRGFAKAGSHVEDAVSRFGSERQ